MPETKIIFLVLPRMHLLDLAGADQAFHEALELGSSIRIEYCSFEKTIETSSGIQISSLKLFSKIEVDAGDYIFVPGAEVDFLLSKEMSSQKGLFNWLKNSYTKGASICSICTGAFLLAAAGLLDGRKCTTHWKRTKQLKKIFPSVSLQENILFTQDERIYTSAGVTSGIDMALHIISKLNDDNFSFKVARELVVYVRRQGNDAQHSIFMSYRNHIHSGIHKVQDYVQENIQRKMSLEHLAAIASMSVRNFTRIFKKETGISVNNYLTQVRKERLLELSKNPDLTRTQMAKQCGLKSERHAIRLLNTS